ncbi:MAG: hypothetical protein JJ889_10060 [Maricaulis sp.]|nr:hypothetical protein [Maricaulis sp.]
MGELERALQVLMATDWVGVTRAPAVAVPFGIFLALYALKKLRLMIVRRSKVGGVRLAMNQAINCGYFGALNAAVFILIAVLFFEAFTEMGFALAPWSDRAQHYAEVTLVVGTVMALIVAGLVGWVLIGIASRNDLANKSGNLKYIHGVLEARGVGYTEVFGFPLLLLVFNVGPWGIRLFQSAAG